MFPCFFPLKCCAAGCGRWPSLSSRRGTCLDTAARWRNGPPEGGGVDGWRAHSCQLSLETPQHMASQNVTGLRPYSMIIKHIYSVLQLPGLCFAPIDEADNCNESCVLLIHAFSFFCCFFSTRKLLNETGSTIQRYHDTSVTKEYYCDFKHFMICSFLRKHIE